MDILQYRSAAMAAQGVLAASNRSLAIDGKWGHYTQLAFERADASVRSRVDAVLGALGTSVGELTAVRANQRVVEDSIVSLEGKEWIPETEAKAYVRRVATQLGIAEYSPALEQFIDFEAVSKTISGLKFYKVTSQNGSSKGLFQMQPAAWKDAQKVKNDLPGYDRGVFVAEHNIAAGVAYAKRSVDALVRKGKPVTGENLYLAHNQGLGHFDGIVTGFDAQSSLVRGMIKKSIVNQGLKPRFVGAHTRW